MARPVLETLETRQLLSTTPLSPLCGCNNHAPVACPDSANVQINSSRTLQVLANDKDADGDPLSVTSFTQPRNGTVTRDGANGLSYRPKTGYLGKDTFQYTIADGQGGTASALVTMWVNPVRPPNRAPIARDDRAGGVRGQQMIIGVLNNDTDPDGDRISLVSFAAMNTAGGRIRQDGNRIIYLPKSDFTGVDTFSYTITDGKGGRSTAKVSVEVKNFAPEARDDDFGIWRNETLRVGIAKLMANDRDRDGDTLQLASFSTTSDEGGSIRQEGQNLVYRPARWFVGVDQFQYTFNDGHGGQSTATVFVRVGVWGAFEWLLS